MPPNPGGVISFSMKMLSLRNFVFRPGFIFYAWSKIGGKIIFVMAINYCFIQKQETLFLF
jgi:hypothetical protein